LGQKYVLTAIFFSGHFQKIRSALVSWLTLLVGIGVNPHVKWLTQYTYNEVQKTAGGADYT